MDDQNLQQGKVSSRVDLDIVRRPSGRELSDAEHRINEPYGHHSQLTQDYQLILDGHYGNLHFVVPSENSPRMWDTPTSPS
ncbi:hypothetical protein P691DRAFT_129948 [Macrolepiota fuliginosa MF-IS2]|uniref:Uncharacterized protein n=1 Tax=Macrolepiota fuliginosa MF-IS2 TaxID=1400762 RepID=A0A9P5XCW5_9AGAR|nr:hypothetical protein P691DRAFT_129948 [Macrolepiota fuliginosa MF-IS2]